jgi:hypothetical protein
MERQPSPEEQMTAMMVVMVFFLVMGPHHGFMGWHETTPPSAESALQCDAPRACSDGAKAGRDATRD